MRGDGVPAARGILDSEAVEARILKAEGAFLALFQETGLQDPQGMVQMENQRRHHGYRAFLGVDPTAAPVAAVHGGLLIALRADVFVAEEFREVVDIVPGKAMAIVVVTASGTLSIVNVHGPGSGGHSRASTAFVWANMAMYAAAKSAGGTRAVHIGGDRNFWLDSLGHSTTKRFVALWEQFGFPGRDTRWKKTVNPNVTGTSWTPTCSTLHWFRGPCDSAHTWRCRCILRR